MPLVNAEFNRCPSGPEREQARSRVPGSTALGARRAQRLLLLLLLVGVALVVGACGGNSSQMAEQKSPEEASFCSPEKIKIAAESWARDVGWEGVTIAKSEGTPQIPAGQPAEGCISPVPGNNVNNGWAWAKLDGGDSGSALALWQIKGKTWDARHYWELCSVTDVEVNLPGGFQAVIEATAGSGNPSSCNEIELDRRNGEYTYENGYDDTVIEDVSMP